MDDIKNRTRMCEQILQQCLGKHFSGTFAQENSFTYIEKEINRLANTMDKPIKPVDVPMLFQFGQGKAQRILKEMLAKAILIPAGHETSRIRSYSVNHVNVNATWV